MFLMRNGDSCSGNHKMYIYIQIGCKLAEPWILLRNGGPCSASRAMIVRRGPAGHIWKPHCLKKPLKKLRYPYMGHWHGYIILSRSLSGILKLIFGSNFYQSLSKPVKYIFSRHFSSLICCQIFRVLSPKNFSWAVPESRISL